MAVKQFWKLEVYFCTKKMNCILAYVFIWWCLSAVSQTYSQVESNIGAKCLPDHCLLRNLSAPLYDPLSMSKEEFDKSPCFCDDACGTYGDCCVDKSDSSKVSLSKQWKCLLLPGNENVSNYVYAINSCPERWADEAIARHCERKVSASNEVYSYLLDLPVIGTEDGKFYSNLYCAQCHGKIHLQKLTLSIRAKALGQKPELSTLPSNAIYVPGKHIWTVTNSSRLIMTLKLEVDEYDKWTNLSTYFPRRCKPVIDQCPTAYKMTEVAEKCEAYASYVNSHKQSKVTYKNKHCAHCHENTAPDSFRCYDMNNRDLMPTPRLPPSFSVVLDFGPGSGSVGYETCKAGEIIEPLRKTCVAFGCGELFEKIDGKCVPKDDIVRNSSYIQVDCPTLSVHSKDVIVLKDGSIFVNGTGKIYKQGYFERYNNTGYRVCETYSYWDKFSVVQSLLSLIAISVSLCCLTLHIVVHVVLPKLQNLPGKIIISLSASLFVGQATFFFGIRTTDSEVLCVVNAVLIHYCFLASFFWMNIMAIDVYRTFAGLHLRVVSQARARLFYRYSAYAWLAPSAIVSSSVIVDFVAVSFAVRPHYGQHVCWIGDRLGLLVFFAAPLAVILLVNVILFLFTACGIYRTSRDMQSARRSKECTQFYLYVKLAFIMGLTWIMGFVAAFADVEVVWYIFIILNASQGAFIFILFTFKRKVYVLLRERLSRNNAEISIGFGSSSRKTSTSRLTSQTSRKRHTTTDVL